MNTTREAPPRRGPPPRRWRGSSSSSSPRMRPLADVRRRRGGGRSLSAGLVEGGGRRRRRAPQTVFRGGSGPVLVLLHGAGDQAAAWSLVAPKLLAGRTLVVPDLAGHGDSAPETGPLPVETLLAGLAAVLDEAAPKEPVTIVGNSLGAWLATALGEGPPGARRADRPRQRRPAEARGGGADAPAEEPGRGAEDGRARSATPARSASPTSSSTTSCARPRRGRSPGSPPRATGWRSSSSTGASAR